MKTISTFFLYKTFVWFIYIGRTLFVSLVYKWKTSLFWGGESSSSCHAQIPSYRYWNMLPYVIIIQRHFPYWPWYQPETPISSPTAKLEVWYQGRYGKFHVIIYLSHILPRLFKHWLLYCRTDLWTDKFTNKSLRGLVVFVQFANIVSGLVSKWYQTMSICIITLESVSKI